MQRVLDIDLDFFVYGRVEEPSSTRLDPAEYPAWDAEDAMSYLQRNLGLTGRLPGCAIQHHRELFFRWRDAISADLLTPRFKVAHVDAHADLGQGDSGYVYLLSNLLHKPVAERCSPSRGLEDGNYLAFAIGCQWFCELDYVIGGVAEYVIEDNERLGDARSGDVPYFVLDGLDVTSRTLRLPMLDRDNLLENLSDKSRLKPLAWEPPVPLRYMYGHEYHATQPFDYIALARSPEYTPATADPIYDAIREGFIDEAALAG